VDWTPRFCFFIFHTFFAEFCRIRYFKFLIFVLTKNLEMDSSFLEILFQIYKNIKFDRLVF
jgi:hypothetical protein